jgi:hypothetical protein
LADEGPEELDAPGAPAPTSSATIADHTAGMIASLVEDGAIRPGGRILESTSHGGHLQPFLDPFDVRSVILERDPARADQLRSAGHAVALWNGVEPPDAVASGGSVVPPDGFDVVIDSYLLAHRRHPRAALGALASMVAPGGRLVLEADYILDKIDGSQFDAFGLGHFSYPTVTWFVAALADEGLSVVDASAQAVYGGAIRISAIRGGERREPAVDAFILRETEADLREPAAFDGIRGRVADIGGRLRAHLEAARVAGRPVVGYGAPGRAVTFLNTLDIGPGLLPFTVDRATAKHGRTIPGTRIPIRPTEALAGQPGADVLVLTWNLADEIRASMPLVEASGGRFLVAIPELAVVGDGTRAPL